MTALNVCGHDHLRRIASLAAVLLAAGAFVGAWTAAAKSPEEAAWAQWRGPSRDGSVPGTGWPENLEGLERVWRVELGEGYPGPIVFGDKVFVVESVDNAAETVRALDRASGREVWRATWEASGRVPFFAKKNGDWVRSTPAHDGEALYVGGMEEVIVKLDAETGEEIWRVDIPARFGTKVPDFGFASSPLIVGDALYVQGANSLVKLDRSSGETVWRALEGSGKIGSSGAFSSPTLAMLSGQTQLVVQTREALFGVALEDGKVLWSQDVPHFRGMNILTPVVYKNSVLTSPYRNRTFLYEIVDGANGTASRELWSSKVTGYMSTPVVIDSHAYLHLGNGRLSCIDLETGVERWISRPFGEYWSMVTQGDKVLALDAGGELHLLRANPERLEMLDSSEIATQPTWGHLAISGDEIFVRELNAIAAYRWIGPAAQDESLAQEAVSP